jgi:hypothetical protein
MLLLRMLVLLNNGSRMLLLFHSSSRPVLAQIECMNCALDSAAMDSVE